MPVHKECTVDEATHVTTSSSNVNAGKKGKVDVAQLHNKLLRISSSSSFLSSTSSQPLSLVSTNDAGDFSQTPQQTLTRVQSTNNLTDFFIHDEINPHTTDILRPGSTFVGTQQSGRSTYEVKVELKYVDLDQSFFCGYINIKGLTESRPELITYFESEIVSKDVSFFTRDKSWGANADIDIQHWSKFPAWHTTLPVKKILDKSYIHKEPFKNQYLFMRWKEKFLVPDAKSDDLEGASFAGFYYICYNQVTGDVSGLYYHKSSERFQQLELCHVPTNGVVPTFQFL